MQGSPVQDSVRLTLLQEPCGRRPGPGASKLSLLDGS